ncbi:hypothetical protein CCACVL1_19331 [Corchorus capsularis]|uniref:Uncharacterized protein n=1 Tax=Corchorus capsularis TaxID=210143 RepID=A0A1R3HH07_COCAP|nr:hypothetical protein CCACVL1_19331 [Corchorus capsularis]
MAETRRRLVKKETGRRREGLRLSNASPTYTN